MFEKWSLPADKLIVKGSLWNYFGIPTPISAIVEEFVREKLRTGTPYDLVLAAYTLRIREQNANNELIEEYVSTYVSTYLSNDAGQLSDIIKAVDSYISECSRVFAQELEMDYNIVIVYVKVGVLQGIAKALDIIEG